LSLVIAIIFQKQYSILLKRWQTFKNETFIPYRLYRNPGNTPVAEVFQNPEGGTNCELFVQAIVRARGFVLPDGIRSSQLYQDTKYTQNIPEVSQAQTGDIIGLCAVGKIGFVGIHIGIIWRDQTDRILIVHNAKHAGASQTQGIEEAMQHRGHEKIAWIKRPVVRASSFADREALKKIGLDYLA